MKRLLTLKKSVVVVAVCMAVVCLPGYSEPTPEQVAERTRLLVQAIENDDVERVKLCIKLGADVNAKIYNGHTVLISVIENGLKDMAEALIEGGADVNVKSSYDYTALMIAANSGWKDIAELLIKAGADVNAKTPNGFTALMMTAFDEDKEITELLIKAGADINTKNNDGGTALVIAAGYEHKEIAELLIKAGADSSAALIRAVKNNKYDAVKLLIELGANVNATDNEGVSALDYAILYGKNDIADMLRAAGARE